MIYSTYIHAYIHTDKQTYINAHSYIQPYIHTSPNEKETHIHDARAIFLINTSPSPKPSPIPTLHRDEHRHGMVP